MKKAISTFLLALVVLSVSAQFRPGSYTIAGYTLPYQVMFPENYEASKQYPLVIFLHGAGERGNDNLKQLTHGRQFLTDHFRSVYPAIVIAPQCPADSFWANVERHELDGRMTLVFGLTDEATRPMHTLMALIRHWIASGKVDTRRIYIGGLSMGGMGTLELLWRMPDTFTAAFPICGGGDTNKLGFYAGHTAVWLFHGDADSVVPVRNSRVIYEQLKALGGDVRYTEYPDVNHNSWDRVFEEPDLVPWLFEHRKK